MPSVAQSAQVCYPGRFKHLPLSPHTPAHDHPLSLPAWPCWQSSLSRCSPGQEAGLMLLFETMFCCHPASFQHAAGPRAQVCLFLRSWLAFTWDLAPGRPLQQDTSSPPPNPFFPQATSWPVKTQSKAAESSTFTSLRMHTMKEMGSDKINQAFLSLGEWRMRVRVPLLRCYSGLKAFPLLFWVQKSPVVNPETIFVCALAGPT